MDNQKWQEDFAQALQSPQKKWFRHLTRRAAVAILLQETPGGLSLLMIRRAVHEKDRWSGQMGFPGGKQDAEDTSIEQTALRELREELGVHTSSLRLLGRLSDINARSQHTLIQPMVITPFVYAVIGEISITPNYEVADVVWIPQAHFNHENRKTLTAYNRSLPCYYYRDKCVWGLSLMMIDELFSFSRL